MKITITGRKLTVKDSFRERAERKLNKIGKFFNDDADARVLVSPERDRQTVEVTIRAGGNIFRAEEMADRMEDALDAVVDDLIRKIRKNKTKLEKRLRTATIEEYFSEEPPEAEEETPIVRVKQFTVKPMDAEEAILQMNMLGHAFYMFRNQSTGEINVVYKRKNGDYGLLEPM